MHRTKANGRVLLGGDGAEDCARCTSKWPQFWKTLEDSYVGGLIGNSYWLDKHPTSR